MTYCSKQENIKYNFLIQIGIFLTLNFFFSCFNTYWYISALELQNSSVSGADSTGGNSIEEIENDKTEEIDPEEMDYDEVL